MNLSLSKKILIFDRTLCRNIYSLSGNKLFDSFMKITSYTAEGEFLIILSSILILNNSSSFQTILLMFIVAFGIELLLQKLAKHYLKRQRPYKSLKEIKLLITIPDKYSFPSGHTAAAFIIATFSMLLGMNWIIFIIWAFIVGFSRIYNGAHYPSDVLFGALLGIGSAFLGYVVI